jgi:hypothetical protein
MTAGESSSSPRRITATEKRCEALELRKGGATFEQIARAVGYSGRGAACNAVQRELAALPRTPAQELLTLELERLDALQRRSGRRRSKVIPTPAARSGASWRSATST